MRLDQHVRGMWKCIAVLGAAVVVEALVLAYLLFAISEVSGV